MVTGLADAGLTVATAESLTGGLLTAVLTEVPGASAVVRGGLVVYGTDLKQRLAAVDPAVLAEHGPVHPQVARQLAAGAARTCGADLGVGLTGVAGPDRQHGVAVGTCYIAVSDGGFAALGPADPAAGQGRGDIRAAAVRAAVGLLEQSLRAAAGGAPIGDRSPTAKAARDRGVAPPE